jgi:UDP-N-acetylglucosamine--N-acetylmuramyl-(pentapeptide) pyrophosphoryl-undecaprenol N-acetylglucosamine transferase
MQHKKILIMAGGTGGHVFPGLAVAELWRAQGHEVVWLGTLHGLDAKLVPAAKLPFYQIKITGLRGRGLLDYLQAPWKIFRATLQSIKLIRQLKPDVVLSMGGYVAGPGGLAAWLSHKPLIVHEQNAIPGTTNKLLSYFAKHILTAFPIAFKEHKKMQWVGNPIRASISALSDPNVRFAARTAALKVLVLGGSQGAQKINQSIPQVLAALPIEKRPEILHQTGARHYEATLEEYKKQEIDPSPALRATSPTRGEVKILQPAPTSPLPLGERSTPKEAGEGKFASIRVVPFIDDITAAYAWADLIICRSGALTVSEIAGAGIASILIPFPYAVDDHQTANAKVLVDVNAAIMIQERDLKVEKLQNLIQDFTQHREKLMNMAMQARTLAKPEATQQVLDICLKECL